MEARSNLVKMPRRNTVLNTAVTRLCRTYNLRSRLEYSLARLAARRLTGDTSDDYRFVRLLSLRLCLEDAINSREGAITALALSRKVGRVIPIRP
jgi:hypothetical protein